MLAALNLIAVLMMALGATLPLARKALSAAGISRLISLRAGILLAVTFTEILPEAWRASQVSAGWGALIAYGSFLAVENFAMLDSCPEYPEECRVHALSGLALLALSAHSFIDGFNLTVSFSAGSRAGLAVGLALSLHKIADGFTLTSLFERSGLSGKRGLAALLCVAAATPLGSFLGYRGFSGLSPAATARLLGFAGGSFLYIASTDVLPYIHKSSDRTSLACFGLGMFSMAALKIL